MIKYYISMGISVAVIVVIAGLAVMDAEPKQPRSARRPPGFGNAPGDLPTGEGTFLGELHARGVLEPLQALISSGIGVEEVIQQVRGPLTQAIVGDGPDSSLIPEEFLEQVRGHVNEWWMGIDADPVLKENRDKAEQLMEELKALQEEGIVSAEEIQEKLNEALQVQPELTPFVMPREQLVHQNAVETMIRSLVTELYNQAA